MKIKLLMLFFIALGFRVKAQTETLIKVAENVTGTSGGYTFAVVLLAVFLVILSTTVVYLYKENQKLHSYTRDISEKAITSIGGVMNVLNNIDKIHGDAHSKLETDHQQIKKDLAELIIKMR